MLPSYISTFLADDVTQSPWEEIKNTIDPPLFCMESYTKHVQNMYSLHTTSLLHHTYNALLSFFKTPSNFFSSQPSITSYEQTKSNGCIYTLKTNTSFAHLVTVNVFSQLIQISDDEFVFCLTPLSGDDVTPVAQSNDTFNENTIPLDPIDSFDTSFIQQTVQLTEHAFKQNLVIQTLNAPKTSGPFLDQNYSKPSTKGSEEESKSGLTPKTGTVHYYHVKKLRDGIQFECHFAPVEVKSNTLLINYINFQRRVVYHLNEYLLHSTPTTEIAEMFRQFHKYLNLPLENYTVIHRNSQFTVYANYDKSELVIYGGATFACDIQNLVKVFAKNDGLAFLFPGSKDISKTKHVRCTHRESPYFGEKNVCTDCITETLILEGNFFVATQSTNKMVLCKNSHEEGQTFSVVMAAEQIEWIGEKAQSVYYYHFFTPQFRNMTVKAYKEYINIISSAILSTRIGIQFGCALPDPEMWFTTATIPFFDILRLAIFMSVQVKKDKPFLYVPLELPKVPQTPLTTTTTAFEMRCRFSYVSFTDLDERVVTKVMSYLPLESVCALMKTSRKYFGIGYKAKYLWKTFYEVHCSPQTFKKWTSQKMPHQKIDYFLAVGISRKTSSLWTRRPVSIRKMKLCEQKIDWIHRTESGESAIISRSGFCCKLYPDFSMKYRAFGNSEVSGSCSEQNDIYVGFGNGRVRFYWNNDPKDFREINTLKFQRIEFAPEKKMIGWNERSNVVYFCDLNLNKTVCLFKAQRKRITHAMEVERGVIVTSSTDGSYWGFDWRMENKVFESQEMLEGIDVFDSFDNYLVGGSSDGTVWMYDWRKLDKCLDRTTSPGKINQVKVWNRKIVVCSEDRSVYSLECCKNWMGKMSVVYSLDSPVTALYFDDVYLLTATNNGCMYTSIFK
ncbi:hypothetical protein EIN_131910 [Entamoeba invadens IP1]|uniref:F-box domain-containing protein n=1 Tax=Entamoeba invadens IP1 TaxID=370355 RepID=A0A0A1UD32_ENTIV|nr:hypothetical protein EIN_131910 [Entamoeba invadens IP1]ELP94342.1 hypothetical protein EIN_131910 [Entamoeba invadens IP1]|eukprot:XP_004261113.1 hypothetical protein EIN_131910 [Entamoeba invadens IP1]